MTDHTDLIARLRMLKGDESLQDEAAEVIAALVAELDAAIPAMREYARQNPTWTCTGLDGTQDPCGAHAWLARNDKGAS
jgi:hypothetical protein